MLCDLSTLQKYAEEDRNFSHISNPHGSDISPVS